MKAKSWLTLVWAILGASLTVGLIACGGGGDGGGGGLSYNGLRTQALINEGNAFSLAVGTWLSGDTGTKVDIFGAVKAEQEFPNNSFSLGVMPFIFEDVIDLIEIPHGNTQPYLGAVQQIDQPPMYGTCGGSATITGSANDETGAINATVNFENYCDEGVTINGPANLTGTVDLPTEELSNFTLSFSTLTFEESGESLSINGSFSADYTVTPMLVTMSYVLRDNNLMKTYWLKDAQFQLEGQMDYVDITGLSGRYYDPVQGYVDISVGDTIRINDSENWPSSGSLILTGSQGTESSNTKARLTFLSFTEFQVDADTDGDGFYDDYNTGTQSWANQ